MVWRKGFFNGVKKALRIYLEIAVIIIPLFVLVAFLKHLQVFPVLEEYLSPFMGLFGLSGTATIALLTGFFLNAYGAIGIISALNLGWKEITILAVMLTICHEVIVESAILKKIGGNPLRITSLRFALAFGAGFVLNLVL